MSRRSALALGVTALAGTAIGVKELTGPEPVRSATTARLAHGGRVLVAHRGSGDVLPEHSMPAYQAAVDWGARCLEVSVDITSDGVLVCMHDRSYDRTTTGHGLVAAQPSSVLADIGILQPQLGPRWTRSPLPAVPLLRDVLRAYGNRAVLCLEAKDDAAYDPMLRMVDELGLRHQVIIKAYHRSRRIEQARRAGYPVFGYLVEGEVTASAIHALAARLDPRTDCLVLPTTTDGDLALLPDVLVRTSVRTGVPVWVYPVHRRSEADHFFSLGVIGAVCSSYGYVAGSVPRATTDSWAGKAIASGEMTRRPADPRWAPQWTGPDELLLALRGHQHFITLGQLCPIPTARTHWTLQLQACWRRLPADLTSSLSIAFGHDDDRYYEQHLGASDGYHAVSRPDGLLQLWAHARGNRDGTLLASVQGAPAVQGQWTTYQLDVTPSTVAFSRPGTTSAVTAADTRYRGGYLHVGRTAADDTAALALRRLSLR